MSHPHTEGLVADAKVWREKAPERAPSYHRILEEIEGMAGEIAPRIEEAWEGRSFSIFYERPLLLLAALRFDALARRDAHPLWPALRDDGPDPSSVSRGAVRAALEPDAPWRAMHDRYVQTNETSRAVAWLWPAWLAGCDRGARPLALVELGCAAGLNLAADRMDAPWTDAAGAKLPVVRAPSVALRLGIDRTPVLLDETSERWLRACIWAGETARLARFDAAVRAFRELDPPAVLEPGDVVDAGERLARVSAELPEGGIVIAFQTIVRDYLDAAANDAYERTLRAWLASAPPGAALWTELEIDPIGGAHPAAIRAHARDADAVIGRTGYHPAEVAVDEAAVRAVFGAR